MDLTRRKSCFLVVTREFGCLGGESVEDIVDERVQDGHSSLGNTSIWVDLLQHSVDISRIGFHSLGTSLATCACSLS